MEYRRKKLNDKFLKKIESFPRKWVLPVLAPITNMSREAVCVVATLPFMEIVFEALMVRERDQTKKKAR